MGKSKGIFSFFKRSTAKKGEKCTTDVSAGGIRGGEAPLWWYSTNPALCVSTAYRCINLLASSVANLPVRCEKKSGTIFKEDLNGTLPVLLNIEPDKAMTAFDFWRQLEIEVLCAGNAYVVPVYNPSVGGWSRLALCGRGTVAHNTLTDTYTVTDSENGIFGTFDESEIIHIKGMTSRNYKKGMSVLSYARMTLAGAEAGDKEAYERFSTGGLTRGILSVKPAVDGSVFMQNNEKAAQDVAKSIDRQQSEMNIIALPGEYDFKQFSMSSADMQFLESRKFTVREICRFFGVHPSFVFDDTSNNYKSAEMATVAFLSNTLNPILLQIENEFLRKLFPPSLWMKRKIEFDRRGLYACDLDSRAKYISSMIAAGLYTVNEARAMENREPVEGGDKVLVSANLKGLEELTSVPQTEPTKEQG